VVLVDDVHTLVDIVIIDSSRIDLVSHAILFYEIIITIVVHVKDDFYYDQYLTTNFSF
jgi:hypothetical protein